VPLEKLPNCGMSLKVTDVPVPNGILVAVTITVTGLVVPCGNDISGVE